MSQGRGGNQGVVRADGRASGFQFHTDAGGLRGAFAIEGQDLQRTQQGGQRRQTGMRRFCGQAHEAVAQFVFHNGRHADVCRGKRLQTGHDLRVAAKVIADGVAVEQKHDARSKAQARHIGGLHGAALLTQRKISKPACQREAVLRPFLRGIFADDVGHPATFRYAVGPGGLIDQRLRGVVEIEGDL